MHGKRIEIRWSDIDSSRHVNNAVYLAYLEDVRGAWLASLLGVGDQLYDFTLVRVAIDFSRELTLADVAVVATCRLERIGTSSITTREEIRTEGGELAAQAESVLVAWNQDAGTSRPLTDAERTALAAD